MCGPYCTGWVNVGWKTALIALTTSRAGLEFRLMFGHFHPHRRNIEDLSFLVFGGFHLIQRCVTMAALGHRMNTEVVWVFHCSQRMSLVTRLSATLFAAFPSQTAGAGHFETITGRWFAAIMAVLGALVFQLKHSEAGL